METLETKCSVLDNNLLLAMMNKYDIKLRLLSMIYNYNSVEIESVHIEFNKANSETTDLCVYVYSL